MEKFQFEAQDDLKKLKDKLNKSNKLWRQEQEHLTQRLEVLEAHAAIKSEALRSLEARRPFGIPNHGLADCGEVPQGVVTWGSL